LLDKVKTWMRRQGGTTELRALVYMDEIFGYFPPHPANPPTKRPLLTLLKQARAQGVSIVLATQNPVDLDYKGLANIGTWLVGRLQTDQDKARLRDGLVGSGADAKAIDRLFDAVKKRVFLLHDVHRSGPSLLGSRWVMSYLRGPLTREEIGRLNSDPGDETIRISPAPSAGPPLLPAPFKHSYFSKYGGELLEAHLLVKYAVRYKNAGETVGLRAYPLAGAAAAEVLEAEPIELDEAAIETVAPDGARFGELPGVLSGTGAKALEKALKDRLPDKLVSTQLFDPQTKTVSLPGEDRDALAVRLGEAGGGPQALKLADQVEKKKRDLALKQQEAKGRQTEKWAALGTAAISVLGGMFGGSKRTSVVTKAMGGISKAGSVLSKNRMETTAATRVEMLEQEIATLEEQLHALVNVDPARFEERVVKPAKTDVKLLRYDVIWVR
jgi:hypothetical protein